MHERRDSRTTRYATGTSDKSVDRAVRDQNVLFKGRLNAANADPRYVPAAPTREACDQLRADRTDLDFKEWNASAGFWGLGRTPTGPGVREETAVRRGTPGVQTEAQLRRARRRAELEDGF